jgi:CheY-like chemotaxis protein
MKELAMARILIAEDDPHILRVISMWLSRNGHTILEARNGVAALELFKAHSPDLLLADVNMPGMDGIELIEAVMADGRPLRGIVMLTNRWDHAQIGERLAGYGVQVLPKPFSPSRLSDLVQELSAAAPQPSTATPSGGRRHEEPQP